MRKDERFVQVFEELEKSVSREDLEKVGEIGRYTHEKGVNNGLVIGGVALAILGFWYEHARNRKQCYKL